MAHAPQMGTRQIETTWINLAILVIVDDVSAQTLNASNSNQVNHGTLELRALSSHSWRVSRKLVTPFGATWSLCIPLK